MFTVQEKIELVRLRGDNYLSYRQVMNFNKPKLAILSYTQNTVDLF